VTSEVLDQDLEPADATSAGSGRALRITLVAVLVAALAVLVGTAGWLIGDRASSSASVSSSSVDAGFARDMSTHHQQAVTMAIYERQYTTSADLHLIAYDIEDTQVFQIGQMQGWLDIWGLTRDDSHPMTWMGSAHAGHLENGLMPGMATPAQMNRLESLRGKALDVMFLQLMIHHHQGGIPMARYALEHAKNAYVQNLARQMVSTQSAEIIQMEQALRKLGGTPLPAPPS
jgi:uncharacterized protein (DUF305 family)